MVAEVPVLTLLNEAYQDIMTHVLNVGDGLVQGGSFTFYGGQGLVLRVWDTNNHQATYGVLGAAMHALWDYMNSQTTFGAGAFVIYDGAVEVGKGTIGELG